jgi:hypothetical protein
MTVNESGNLFKEKFQKGMATKICKINDWLLFGKEMDFDDAMIKHQKYGKQNWSNKKTWKARSIWSKKVLSSQYPAS